VQHSQAVTTDSLIPPVVRKIQPEIPVGDSGARAETIAASAHKTPVATEIADKTSTSVRPVESVAEAQSKVAVKIEKPVSNELGKSNQVETSKFGDAVKLADNRQNAEVTAMPAGKERVSGTDALGAKEVKATPAAISGQPVENQTALSAEAPESQGPEPALEPADFSAPVKSRAKEAAVKLEAKASDSTRVDNSMNLAAAGVEKKESTSKPSPGREASAGEVRIIEQIAEKAAAALSGGRKEMQIQLDPPSLGKVAVKVTSEGGLITAHLQASAPAARDLLQQNLETLKAALEKADLGIGQCTVSLGSEQNSGGETREGQLAELVSQGSFGSFVRPLTSGGAVTRASGWNRGTLDYFA
jgi:flagellar hook-length control protein FliK